MSTEVLSTITNTTTPAKKGLGLKFKSFFTGGKKTKGKENTQIHLAQTLEQTTSSSKSHSKDRISAVRLTQSAPASPRASRKGIAVVPQGASALSKHETQLQAGKLYKSASQSSLNSISASDSFAHAQSYLKHAQDATADDVREKYFKFAEQYAEYAVVLGRKDAVPILQKMYKDGINSLDGKRVLVENSTKNTFWNQVERKQKAGIQPQDIGQLGAFIRPQKNVALGVAVFIHVSNIVHDDPNTQYSIEYAGKLVTHLREMQKGAVKGVPLEMDLRYRQSQNPLSL
mgnify:CR=1 FL=1